MAQIITMCETRNNLTTTLAEILSALQNRRTATSYSTAYYHNERALTLARSILTTQAPAAFLIQNPSIPRPLSNFSSTTSAPTALLYRIVANITSFSINYQAQVAALQARQVHADSITKRRAMAVRFESGHGSGEGRDVDAGTSLAASVMERRGKDLEDELQRFMGGGGPLGSHPVSAGNAGALKPAPEFTLVVEEMVPEISQEAERAEKRKDVIEGVDGDMIVAFWEQYLD